MSFALCGQSTSHNPSLITQNCFNIAVMRGFHLFDTALGHCGIAWSDRGVVAVQLPERDVAHTRARLVERIPEARELTPPATVRDAVGAIAAHLRGERSD